VLRSTLGAILGELRHGDNKPLAAALGLHPVSLSRLKTAETMTVGRAETITAALGCTLADLQDPAKVRDIARRVGSTLEPSQSIEDAIGRLLSLVRSVLPLIRDTTTYGTIRGRVESSIEDVETWIEESDQVGTQRRAALDCHGQP
jgi:DNA-binding Xre family transcriptional regulator